MACPKQPSAGPLRTLYRIIKAHQTNIYIVITLFFDISFYKFDSFACKDTKKIHSTKQNHYFIHKKIKYIKPIILLTYINLHEYNYNKRLLIRM